MRGSESKRERERERERVRERERESQRALLLQRETYLVENVKAEKAPFLFQLKI